MAGRDGLYAQFLRTPKVLDVVLDILPTAKAGGFSRNFGEYSPHHRASSSPWTSAIRVACATNQNLEQLIRDGRFRKDLYYRIREIAVLIPPLRERQSDRSLRAQAAELLGITRPTLYNLLDKFGLRKANEQDDRPP